MSLLTPDMRPRSPVDGTRSLVAAETRLYWRASRGLRGLDGSMTRQTAWRWLSFVARSGSTSRLRRSAEKTFASIGFEGLFRDVQSANESAGFKGERSGAANSGLTSRGVGEKKRRRPDSEPR